MKIVIVGCGRVGSTLAENLDADGPRGHHFRRQDAAFDRLPETFKGAAIRGDGTDEEVLRRAGAEGADIFLSLTEGDNRNVMAAQVATESFGSRRSSPRSTTRSGPRPTRSWESSRCAGRTSWSTPWPST
jgi:trk system potassium uptake protein TrkA